VKIDTTRFGAIEIDDNSILHTPSGLFGFDDQTKFCLIQHRPDTNFRWLQSVEKPSLAFVVIDPADYFTNYEIEIPDMHVEALGIDKSEDAIVLAIVTVGKRSDEITANLVAPVIVNSRTLLGMQIIIQDERYGVKHRLIENVISQDGERSTVEKCQVRSSAVRAD